MKKFLVVVLWFVALHLSAQDFGKVSGNFQSNFSVFERDTVIGATEDLSPQYGKQKSSAEAWLYLNYDIKDFHLAARYDLFNNSNLLNPLSSYSGQGLGFWQIKKDIKDLELTAGYFYDQFGSGHIFRAYENRLIGIDYAMQGIRAKYQITPDLFVKAFTGKQKGFPGNTVDRFSTSPQVIKGINAENVFHVGKYLLTVGAAGINRTLDDATMDNIVLEINDMELPKRFLPKYNTYALAGYFNATIGDFGINGEYNYKTKESIRNINNELFLSDGNILLGGLSYSKRKLGKEKKMGIGANLQYRRIEKFPLTVSPYTQLLDGIITYQPSFTRQAAYRLLARYNAPAQFLGENAYQAEVVFTLNPKNNFQVNYSQIKDANGNDLFEERFIQWERKIDKKLSGKLGLQTIFYNQNVYESHSDYPNVVTLTPFTEIVYKLDRKNSIRVESQYLKTDGDLGSWFHGIVEWNNSPKYTIAVSDMINTKPERQSNQKQLVKEVLHYPTFFVKYNVKTTSLTAAYVKQVEGVNCTGGICRVEPAFSGLRFTLASQF